MSETEIATVTTNATPATLADLDSAAIMEKVIMHGDLSKMPSAEKVQYYNYVCRSLGLNPATQPFAYHRLDGGEKLYARKDACDQLRKLYGVNIRVTGKETIDDVYIVTVEATDTTGRRDEEIGAVGIAGLTGAKLANALMKALTKAKRRVTLSICGLGMLDETEVADAPMLISSAEAEELSEMCAALNVDPHDTEILPYSGAEYFNELQARNLAAVQALIAEAGETGTVNLIKDSNSIEEIEDSAELQNRLAYYGEGTLPRRALAKRLRQLAAS